MNIKFLALVILFSLLTAACALAPVQPTIPPVRSTSEGEIPPPVKEDQAVHLEGAYLGLTYQNLDGNRLLDGSGTIPSAEPLRVPLPGIAAWLAAVPYRDGSLWTAVLEDGQVVTALVLSGKAEIIELGWGPLPAAAPPLVLVRNGEPSLVAPPSSAASPLTHPVPVSFDPLRLAYLETSGDLVLQEDGVEVDRLLVSALPDARLLVDEENRILLLSDPTERYDHGVLGDRLEAGSITLVETSPELRKAAQIEIPAPAVVEGIAPIWVDLDGDGEREILATVSDQDTGARLVLFSESGAVLAEGPAAGQGYRWRHQLVLLPGEGGSEPVVFDVLRPHLDALLEAYTWRGEYLVVMESIPGYPSHPIGSRNLDQALAGDFDGDGVVEVAVPGRERDSLNGIYYHEGVMGQSWSLDLNGQLTTNLAGVSLPDGSIELGVGVGPELVIFGR